jgi:V/A-type H+-transporting ATPase subunit I
MVLKPEKMIRVRVISTLSKKDIVLSVLHDFNAIQIEQVSGDIKNSLGRLQEEDFQRSVTNELQRIKGLENSLPMVPVTGKKAFSSVYDTLREAAKISIDNEVRILKQKQEDLMADIKDISIRSETVEYLRGLNYDLSIFSGKTTKAYVIQSAFLEDLNLLVKSEIKDALIIKRPSALLVVIPIKEESNLARISSENSSVMRIVPEASGMPEEYLASVAEIRKEREKELDEINTSLKQISEKYYSDIVQIREQLEIEESKIEVSERIGSTAEVFVLEGWVPKSRYEIMIKTLDKVTSGSMIISEVETKDEPPTMFNNPRRIRVFEFFIRFYSLPQESEYDPTLIFAIVFPLFFGLMLGDYGYGLVILLFSILILRKLDGKAKWFRFPRKLSNFVVVILGKGPLRTLAKALIPSSIMAIIFGLIFDEFFGFQLYHPQLFNVITSLSKLLLLSGYIGLFMVSLGLVMGFVTEYSRGNRKGAYGKIGWLMFAWGIAVTGLDLIYHNFNSVGNYAALAVAVAGIGTIFVFEGVLGAVELPSMISHILSYTRIVGILLASVILAYVVDLIFLQDAHSFPMVIFGGFILVLGQVFNLAIAIFEPGIQGARLIYVEFFSKFYHGNGKMFHPFGKKRIYTIKQMDIENVEKA